MISIRTWFAGNQAVLRARFQDALFFYKQDLEQRLEEFKPALAGITFQKDLGSMLQKSDRVEQLVPLIAKMTRKEGGQRRATTTFLFALPPQKTLHSAPSLLALHPCFLE